MRWVMFLILCVLFSSTSEGQCPPGTVCPRPTTIRQIRNGEMLWVPSTQVGIPSYTVPTNTVTNTRHWTHPPQRTIEEHMAQSHGVDISGLSSEELKYWHDAIHEMERYGRLRYGRFPTRTREVAKPTVTSKAPMVEADTVVKSSEALRSVSSSGCPIAVPVW